MRLSLGSALVVWVAVVLAAFVSAALAWALAVLAILLTLLAAAHLVVLAKRGGLRAVAAALIDKFKLGCECADVYIGYGLERYFATKQQCQQNGIPPAYRAAINQAEGFCRKHYECVDEDCPELVWQNLSTIDICFCEQARDGRWQAICDVGNKTQCCCPPPI